MEHPALPIAMEQAPTRPTLFDSIASELDTDCMLVDAMLCSALLVPKRSMHPFMLNTAPLPEQGSPSSSEPDAKHDHESATFQERALFCASAYVYEASIRFHRTNPAHEPAPGKLNIFF